MEKGPGQGRKRDQCNALLECLRGETPAVRPRSTVDEMMSIAERLARAPILDDRNIGDDYRLRGERSAAITSVPLVVDTSALLAVLFVEDDART